MIIRSVAIGGMLGVMLLSGCGIRGDQQGAASVDIGKAADVTTASASDSQGTTIKITKDQVRVGNLVLVNRKYPIDAESIPDDVLTLFDHPELREGFALYDKSIRLTDDLLSRFKEMVKDAAGEGVDRWLISSGYRDNVEQAALYEEKGPDYANPAGHSEHNLGLSLDIGSTRGGGMAKAPEGAWLQKNAWKYGFILRYPKDKADITGTQYEPWHFRYVGLPHSKIMHDRGLVLEEYLDELREKRTISAKVNGVRYEITYVPVRGSTRFQLPKGASYELSGDNREGVIVTVRVTAR